MKFGYMFQIMIYENCWNVANWYLKNSMLQYLLPKSTVGQAIRYSLNTVKPKGITLFTTVQSGPSSQLHLIQSMPFQKSCLKLISTLSPPFMFSLPGGHIPTEFMTKTTLLSPMHVIRLISRGILHDVHGTAYDAFKQLWNHVMYGTAPVVSHGCTFMPFTMSTVNRTFVLCMAQNMLH